MHGVPGLPEALRQPLDAAAHLGKPPRGRALDELARFVEVSEGRAVQDRRVRMSLVVVHHVRDRRAQRDVVHPEPVDQADERGSLARIVHPEIGRQQVHRLVVELGQEGAARPVGVLLVHVLVAVDAAAKARLGLDDEVRLDVVAEHQLRLAVARGPEVVLGDEVELLERLVVRPGPAEPAFVLLAELARSGAARHRLVDVADLRLQLRDAVRRLRDDRQHALVPMTAPMPPRPAHRHLSSPDLSWFSVLSATDAM